MLAKGTKAPEFELSDQDGRKHTLKSLLAGGPLILYFYPADFTPGCTKEAWPTERFWMPAFAGMMSFLSVWL